MSERFLSLAQLAAIAGADAPPAGDAAEVRRVASLAECDGESLVFAETREAEEAALASRAGAILLGPGEALADARVLRVRNPRLAFARCARELAALDRPPARVHSTASVDESARLGRDVRIGAGAVIEAGVVLGDEVEIGSRVVVREGVVLGNRVVVQAGAVLGSTGFGFVRDPGTGSYLLFPQQGRLVIEDDVEIGANTTIDRGALEETRIGAGSKIDNLVHIGHNCRIGRNVVIAAQVGISGSSVVEDGAILAGQVGISDHCHIGPGVILGGQAGVYRGKSVEGAGEVFSGTPAEPLKDQMRALALLRAQVRARKR